MAGSVARTTEIDYDTRAANEDCINGGSRTRTKYGYDSLDRLTSASEIGTTLGWSYDADGNRLQQTGALAANALPTASPSFVFNGRGRMSSAALGSITSNYTYNALGQMIEKSVGGAVTLLVYDEAGHLVGEYSNTGALIQETIWFGDIPVATLRPNGASVSIYYVNADQVNAPRMITRSTDNAIMWRWDTDPFGTTIPNQNPRSLGSFVYNLRFPGQYYNAETGLDYNWHRDYGPLSGRYIESDPIGMAGGSYSTYAYAKGIPIGRIDPTGLASALDEARAMGMFSPSKQQLRPETKSLICIVLDRTNYNFQFADIGVIAMREQYGVFDPTLQEADDFLNAAGWPFPLSYTNNALGAEIYQYQKLLPKPLQLYPSETSFSQDALDAALAGINHQRQRKEEVKQWCNSCDRT
jgi:RHS repeat-associated protein